jgi:hypothetical protein
MLPQSRRRRGTLARLTWQRALAIGLALQFLAGIIFAAAANSADIDGEASDAGMFLFAVVFTAGSVLALAGTIGWGVKLAMQDPSAAA